MRGPRTATTRAPTIQVAGGIDPRTGHHYDDTRRYVDALAPEPGVRDAVYEHNARRVYPRLDALLRGQGR